MKTVIITQAFDVDEPKPATYAAGDEHEVSDATAKDWLDKGLARLKPGPKPETKATETKPASKPAD